MTTPTRPTPAEILAPWIQDGISTASYPIEMAREAIAELLGHGYEIRTVADTSVPTPAESIRQCIDDVMRRPADDVANPLDEATLEGRLFGLSLALMFITDAQP